MNTSEFYVRTVGHGAKKINIDIKENDTMYDLRKRLVDKKIVPNMVFSFHIRGIPFNKKNDFKLNRIKQVFKVPTLSEVIPLDFPIYCYNKDRIIYIFHKDKCLEMINFDENNGSIRVYSVQVQNKTNLHTISYKIITNDIIVSSEPTQDTKIMKCDSQINYAFNGDTVTFGLTIARPEDFAFYYTLPRAIRSMFKIDYWNIIQ